ncbi:hypothetical protein GUY44_18490 [Pimelobacter simplex]|uniref:Capsular polysaccharide biosynthesis protein n=1 Tax=Nocardioides simplex TaxID=2045 RepID=A0A0A1DN84_NOCSI|nr:EpsG family protein [Pimelobacter simplex]AIY18866.1 capsular polysaccharide biosynthesis protein [Pimelobacter simplex]MCG8152481.1 hypothetical protein [Pimelobacter simplex]GEB14593.1 hypothetical protein NSI01_29080 [Pimelobacter simplex]SFM27886.1 EpsG family protein [Pimelobacter simplex]
MTPYLVLLATVLALAALGAVTTAAAGRGAGPVERVGRARWTPFDLVLLGVLVVFAGSRVGVGTDYELYAALWFRAGGDSLGAALDRSPQDPGFVALQHLLHRVGEGPEVMFWVTSAVTVGAMVLALKHGTRSFPAAIFLLVALGGYLAPFNLVRQGLAAALLFLAATRYLDRRRWVFVALVAAATGVHASALAVAVVLLVVRNVQPRPRVLAVLLAGALLAAQLYLTVPAVTRLAELLNPRYVQYVVQEEAGLGTYLVIGARLLLVLYCYLHATLLTPLERRCLVFATLGLAAQVVGTQSIAFARFDVYFALFLVVPLAGLVRAAPDRLQRAAVLGGSLVYMVLLIGNYYGLVPYRSTWWAG